MQEKKWRKKCQSNEKQRNMTVFFFFFSEEWRSIPSCVFVDLCATGAVRQCVRVVGGQHAGRDADGCNGDISGGEETASQQVHGGHRNITRPWWVAIRVVSGYTCGEWLYHVAIRQPCGYTCGEGAEAAVMVRGLRLQWWWEGWGYNMVLPVAQKSSDVFVPDSKS